MQILFDILIFGSKVFLVTVAIGILLILIANLISRFKPPKEQLEVQDLNLRLKDYSHTIHQHTMDEKHLKNEMKAQKKKEKTNAQMKATQKQIYVIDFEGDIKASAVEQFRTVISAVLAAARPEKDEVVVRLESSGGMVHSYGLAAAQLLRVRSFGLNLTICVDKVAASGGYMMACTGNQILASPFAILGSIGVVAQVPNLHRLLKKHDVDYEEFTAGEYKRTVSLLGEITEKGKQKFVEQMEDTHSLFKEFVQQQRPKLDLSQVATGEYWFGQRALHFGLIDKIMSSDEYLFAQRNQAQILEVSLQNKKSLGEKIAKNLSAVVESSLLQWMQKIHDERIFPK